MIKGSIETVWVSIQKLMAIDQTMGKWFLAILVAVFLSERVSFSDLKKVIKPITNKVLANRLKALEAFGLLVKRVVLEHPLRVEYYLTDKGKELAKGFAGLVGVEDSVR